MRKALSALTALAAAAQISFGAETVIWRIGETDNSAAELALGPDRFRDFLENDFGFEDKYYIPGYSLPEKDFPYVLPGPADTWGGTWSTAGWRTHQVNILFELDNVPKNGDFTLTINLLDFAKSFLPKLRVSINRQDWRCHLMTPENKPEDRFRHYRYREPVTDTLSITGDLRTATPRRLEIPVDRGVLRNGGNVITLTVLEGSWVLFDGLELSGPAGVRNIRPGQLFVRDIAPAEYELSDGGRRYQPLIVDIERLESRPEIAVELDGKVIHRQFLEAGRYQIEAPMPAVKRSCSSRYRILENGREIASGTVRRSPRPEITPADYVDTRIGTAHSRWMIAPGPWMPFGMVKLSPDNQNPGWQAGYQPSFESIGCFSHIHEWTVGGLGIMPANGELKTEVGDERNPDSGYRSRMDKRTEEAGIGYYKADLTDYGIRAELTATTRAGMLRFTYPKGSKDSRIMIDIHPNIEKDFQLLETEIRKVGDRRIEGRSRHYVPQMWSDDASQDYTVNFVVEFDAPIKRMGRWVDGKVDYADSLVCGRCGKAGVFVEFDTERHPVITVRTGISPVSIANASLNLQTELSGRFGWNFEEVRQAQKDVWNDIFTRIAVKSSNRLDKVRFYNNIYRAVCGRNTWSDVNGEWVSTDGVVRKVPEPGGMMLSCDAFWNSFWNLNPFWNLVLPEWSSRWVKSQLAMYDANGWLAKGPAALNYIPVMVAEHEIPLMVSAYQMGVRDYDVNKMFEAVVKMQTTPARKVHNGFAGNRDLVHYMKYKYVPSDLGRFSNTMEYSFDDWTVGQLALALGRDEEYRIFNDRGYWWKNVISEDGYCRMRLSSGEWVTPFDPFRTGANRHYVEGNAWQLTYFVPQDVPALVETIGRERFTERLEWGFAQSEPWRYNAPNDQYWDYPVVQGNQQSMHFAFLFNWAGKPWLTQKWSRSILDRYYGCGEANAYLGDEDQGQMSAWAVLASIGLFQTDGGTCVNPYYEIGSPIFEETVIDLRGQYGRGGKFTIKAINTSADYKYVQSAVLNGKRLDSFRFPASELLKGGELVLEMGPEPNLSWGMEE
ncbi:MAG: GH92 family glycosyl hydrolase [Candidatus Cryptobacteroides sp.]